MHPQLAELKAAFQQFEAVKRMTVDHTRVPAEQSEIHETLLNWARWVKPRQTRSVHPMFQQYRHGYEESNPKPACDQAEAVAVEKVLGTMPHDHALVIRWWYVYPIAASRVCRHLGLSQPGLGQMVIDARWMVRNRLTRQA